MADGDFLRPSSIRLYIGIDCLHIRTQEFLTRDADIGDRMRHTGLTGCETDLRC